MNNELLVCPICGEPTRVYMGKARKDRLCGKHADMLKAGEIHIDENGNFLNQKGESASTLTCIICGEASNGKEICKACYAEVMNTQKELDKNKKPWELKDYYYNLKAFIGRLKDYQEAGGNM